MNSNVFFLNNNFQSFNRVEKDVLGGGGDTPLSPPAIDEGGLDTILSHECDMGRREPQYISQ